MSFISYACDAICVASLFASVCCKLVLLFVLQACVCILLDYMFCKFVLLVCFAIFNQDWAARNSSIYSPLDVYGDEQLDLDRTQGVLCSRLDQRLWRDNKRLTAALHVVWLGRFWVNLSCPGGFWGQPRCRVQRNPCLYVWSVEKKEADKTKGV